MAGFGKARILNHHAASRGRVCRGAAWRGTTGQGKDLESPFGMVRRGRAWRGQARLGEGWRGKAGIFKD